MTTSPPKTSRGIMVATIIMGIIILLPSLVGFVNKLMEFGNVVSSETDGVFAMTPLANYTFATLGFFCLLIWTTAQGMFHNIERPKETMMSRESELDVDEPNFIPEWAGGPIQEAN